jgi:stress-induced morphogen
VCTSDLRSLLSQVSQPLLSPSLSFSKLEAALAPTTLHVIDDSSKHAGHAGNPGGGPDAETHFKVDVVSAAFEGKTAVARHRAIYAALGDDFKAGLHALAIKARTPTEAMAAAAAVKGAAGG